MSGFTCRIAPLLLTAFLALGSGGCGLIFGGTTQTIPMASSPEGATVQFDESGRTLTTPTSVELERKNSYVLSFSREGYESRQVEVERSLRGGMLVLDILFTGLVGIVVDAATGGWYALNPERLDVTLTRLEAASAAAGPEEIHVRMRPSDAEDGDARWLRVESDVPVRVRIEEKD